MFFCFEEEKEEEVLSTVLKGLGAKVPSVHNKFLARYPHPVSSSGFLNNRRKTIVATAMVTAVCRWLCRWITTLKPCSARLSSGTPAVSLLRNRLSCLIAADYRYVFDIPRALSCDMGAGNCCGSTLYSTMFRGPCLHNSGIAVM